MNRCIVQCALFSLFPEIVISLVKLRSFYTEVEIEAAALGIVFWGEGSHVLVLVWQSMASRLVAPALIDFNSCSLWSCDYLLIGVPCRSHYHMPSSLYCQFNSTSVKFITWFFLETFLIIWFRFELEISKRRRVSGRWTSCSIYKTTFCYLTWCLSLCGKPSNSWVNVVVISILDVDVATSWNSEKEYKNSIFLGKEKLKYRRLSSQCVENHWQRKPRSSEFELINSVETSLISGSTILPGTILNTKDINTTMRYSYLE